MASRQTIGQLLVEIGLDSSKFLPELKKITQNIKGLERDLKNMSKDFGDVSKSMVGLEQKQETLNKILSENTKLLNEHTKQRDEYADRIRQEKKELDELKNAEVRDEKAIIQKEKALESSIKKYDKLNNLRNKDIDNIEKYTKEQEKTIEQMNKLANGIEDYEEKMQKVNEQTEISNGYFKAQQSILEATGHSWKAQSKEVEIMKNTLASAIEGYKETRKEISKNESEIDKLTKSISEQYTELEKQKSIRSEIAKLYDEESQQYIEQDRVVKNLRQSIAELEEEKRSKIETNTKLSKSEAEYAETVGKTTKSLKEMSTIKRVSNKLQEISEATQGASIVGAGVTSGATAMFMTYESGLAKLSTLCDTSVVDMNKVGQDIIKISNETGTSIGEMMEGAYQAVSAGVDISNLNDFLSTSSKLATSGFTDMSSATKVLSQILNNYGTEAGNAEEIASKLMKTQNLGKRVLCLVY